jgi:branched-chain amino acid transport system permease protein
VARPIQETLFGTEFIAPEALRMLLFGLAMVIIMLYRPTGLLPRPRSRSGLSPQPELPTKLQPKP